MGHEVLTFFSVWDCVVPMFDLATFQIPPLPTFTEDNSRKIHLNWLEHNMDPITVTSVAG